MSYRLIRNCYGPPSDAICYGCQNNGGGLLWSAVAHTEEYGDVGGKANRETCWYSWGGKEHYTTNFSWLCGPEGKIVPVKNPGYPPSGAVSIGCQKNEDGNYYAAIAICDHGLVPGKAKGNTCWYPFGGEEIYVNDFMWLVCI